VDLLGINPKEHRMAAGKKTPPKPAAANLQAKASKPAAPKAASLAKLAPAAGEPQASAAPAAAAIETPAAQPPAAPAPVAPVTDPASVSLPETTPVAPPAQIVEGDGMPIPPGELLRPAVSQDGLKVNLSAAADSAVIRLPFGERVALAAFIRNRHLWIVFNQRTKLDLSDFSAMPQTVVGQAQQLVSDRASALRMPVDDGVFVQAVKQEGSEDWAILLTGKKHELVQKTAVVMNTEPPSPAHVFLNALDIAEPVELVDPHVGDRLSVVPFFTPGHGVDVGRDFVQFSLLPTAQGIAVVKKADDISVVPLRNGVRISMPGGVVLTPGLSEVPVTTATNVSVAAATLFNHKLWTISEQTNPHRFINELFHKIVESSAQQESNEARLRLAQYYLSEGMAPEALAHLNGINRVNPSFYRSNKLAALRGAANFLLGRYVDASRDFNASELNQNKEVDFWRRVLADLLGNNDQSYDYMALNEDYFSKYPPMIRQRLAIVAADRAIAAKEYNNALKIFDSLQKDQQIETISSYINFLMARISLETGQTEEALATYDKLAEDYDRPFVRANAEFQRILWHMNKGTLSKQDAADRLEKLRLSWHGDNLEIQVLTLLSDIYTEQKDYLNAMRIWHNTIQAFPNTAVALKMDSQMQETFVQVFNDGGFDALPPLEALALYYEYLNYAPAGKAGDKLVERLADKLASVDLLEQAASLLDRQMKFKVEKDKRSRLGARLATIQLMNREPKKAIKALEESMYGDNPLLLKLYRNQLTAESLIDVGELERAMEVLNNDTSIQAEKLRQTIYWKRREWKPLANSIEMVLKQRQDTTAPITMDESELLLKLSLAYIFTNDVPQLLYLRDYFGPLMKDNPNRDLFEFVTTPDISLTTRNFDKLIERLETTRSFIGSYQARINAAGLASAPAMANAAPSLQTQTP